MKHQIIIEIQILLEIAMSIGNRLDLTDMLKESIQAYLRKLDLSGGAVFRMKETVSGNREFSDIFSIPRRIARNRIYQEVLSSIPDKIKKEELEAFLGKLPIIKGHGGMAYAVCSLPGFGLLILIGPEDRVCPYFMKSLQPINNKLANACIACTQNARLIEEIARRESAENRRKKLQAQLEQSRKLESIGALAGGIAHDFNNILFPIVGMSEMLIEDLPDKSTEQQYAHEILKAGKRAADLVGQILAFSRQDERQILPVSIQSVLKEVLKLCRSTIPSNIEIHQSIQHDCGLVEADPTQIHQVAMNLITNAYHAVEEKSGKIFVHLKTSELSRGDLPGSPVKPGWYVQFTVCDTGGGIDPGIIDKIFDPYFTTKKKGKGTGLGLATVYGIVRKYQGDIVVYSELGKGSTFNVFLPVMEETAQIKTTPESETLQTGSERILLVDDEKAIAEVEKIILERLGYRVTPFTSSIDALKAFQSNPDAFDLVITDMAMPQMTGDLFSKELKKIRSDIPVIICSGFSERINTQKTGVIGVDGILMKPLLRTELSKKIREVLDKKTN